MATPSLYLRAQQAITKAASKTVSVKTIVMAMLIVVLMVALLFIQEIVDFQGRFFGEQQMAQVAEPELDPTEKEPVEDKKKNALFELNALLEGRGRRGSTATLNTAALNRGASQTTDLLESARAAFRSDKAPPSKRALNPEGPGEEPLSWQLIRSAQSTTALKRAYNEALVISRALPPDKTASRFALLNYASGVKFILEGDTRSMSPREALRYLEQLDSTVTETLQREGVERQEFNRWTDVNVGPAFARSLVIGGKATQKMTFSPRLTLTRVRVIAPGSEKRRAAPKNRGEPAPTYVRMEGFVYGKDVSKVEFIVNGESIASTVPGRKADRYGRRFFKTRQLNAYGNHLLRVYSRFGEIYEKSYVFYPRVQRFPVIKGKYDIPFFGDRDRRLDRYFTSRLGRLVEAQGLSLTGSQDFSTF